MQCGVTQWCHDLRYGTRCVAAAWVGASYTLQTRPTATMTAGAQATQIAMLTCVGRAHQLIASATMSATTTASARTIAIAIVPTSAAAAVTQILAAAQSAAAILRASARGAVPQHLVAG